MFSKRFFYVCAGLCGIWATANAQPKSAAPAPDVSVPISITVPVNVTVKDTMTISVKGGVADIHVGEGRIKRTPSWGSLVGPGLSAVVAVATVFLTQWRRDRSEKARSKARLITRIRCALESGMLTFKVMVARKADGTKELDPQTLNGVVLEWKRYDRVSDDIGLLGDPMLEEGIDNILGALRMVAEAALEDERRFKKDLEALSERVEGGIKPPQSLVDRIHNQRRTRLGQMATLRDAAKGVLDSVNSKWPPAEGHKRANVPETVEGATT